MNKTRSSFLVDFFGALSGEKIYVSALANDSTLKGKFPPKQIASTDAIEIDTFIANHDVVGRGIFFCVSPIRGDAGASKNKDAVSSLVCLHADIDFKSIVGNRTSVLTALGRLGRAPTYTVVSGHGVHIYFCFSTPLMATPDSVAQVENAARRLADVVGGDRQVAEVSRVMRMPGSHNSKDPDDIVPCEVIDASHKRYAFGDLVTWLGVQEPVIERVTKPESVEPSKPKEINFFSQFGAEHARGESLDLDALWESMYYPGNVHETEVRVIASLLSRGENVDNAIAFVIQGITDHVPEAATWNLEREQRELRKMAVGWFVKHPDLMEMQIDPPAWLLANRDIRTKVLPHVKLAPSDGAQGPKPGPQTGSGSRVVDFTPSHTNGTARKMDEPPQGEIEQEENAVDKESDPAPEKAKAPDGATIHEFPKGGERVHLKTVAKPEPVPDIVFEWGEEIEKRPIVQPQWIVQDYVLRGALNGYFGDGGVGKDLTLQQLCTAMATKKDWLGQKVEPGRAFYMNVEDNWDTIRYRMDSILNYYGTSFQECQEKFMASSMMGTSTVLAAVDGRSGMVKPTGLYDKLCDVIDKYRPDLVVVGNRVNIFAVNQNDDAQARQCLELLNAIILRYGTTIIMPGHVSLTGMANNTGMSGSVQWNNGVRHRIFLQKTAKATDEEVDAKELRKRLLTVMKSNWGPDGKPIEIAWSDDAKLFVPLEEAEGFTVEPRTDEEKAKFAEREFLSMLELLNANQTRVTSNINSSKNYAPKVMIKHPKCAFHKRPYIELENAMHRLMDRDAVKLVPYGFKSDRTFHLVASNKVVQLHPENQV